MLVYMSSYPRSGSSLLQQLINYAFKKPWSGVDIPEKPLEEITGVPKYFENWRYRKHPWQQKSLIQKAVNKINKMTLNYYNIEPWIATYDLSISPYTKNCTYLLPGCLDVLTPNNRQKLSLSNEVFFIKTHFMPYKRYFDGEFVIQMIRHPGPVFISYTKLLLNRGKRKRLEDIIQGDVLFGAWNEWHQAWRTMAKSLGDRFLCLRYEDVLLDKHSACEAIKSTIHYEYDVDGISDMPSFDHLKKQVPNYYGVGKSDGWEMKYTAEQKKLFYQLHGQVLADLGYQ